MKLYYAPGACSLASHIVIEEVGVAHETQRLNLQAGDQRKPEYLAVNPRGRVPALVVDGRTLTENTAIMAYLACGYPQAGLWPKEPWEQAQLLSLMAWLAATVQGTYGHLVRPERYADDEAAKAAMKEKARGTYGMHLREIDAMLAGRPWAIGKRYSVADAYLLVFYRWGNRQGFPVRELKGYSGVMDRVLARPAVKKVMADEGITLD